MSDSTHENLQNTAPVDGFQGSAGAVSAKSVTQLEADIIRQEHRAVLVVLNFFRRKQWDKSDPRRGAAVAALAWSFISPSSVAVTGGGLVALATVLILLHQNSLLTGQNNRFDEQNALIAEQNTYFRRQNEVIREQIEAADQVATKVERTSLIRTLYSTGEAVTSRERTEALVAFIAMERRRLVADGQGYPVDLTGANLSGTRLIGEDLSNCDLSDANLTDVYWAGVSLVDSRLGTPRMDRAYIVGNFDGIDIDCIALPDLIYELPEPLCGHTPEWYEEFAELLGGVHTSPAPPYYDLEALADFASELGFEWREDRGLDPALDEGSAQEFSMRHNAQMELLEWSNALCEAFTFSAGYFHTPHDGPIRWLRSARGTRTGLRI